MNIVKDSTKLSRPVRRELEKKAKKGVSRPLLEEITAKVKGMVMLTTVELFSVAVAWVLKDKLNYGYNKVKQTMKQVNDIFDKINSGELDLNEMKRVLNEECDLVFTRNGEEQNYE